MGLSETWLCFTLNCGTMGAVLTYVIAITQLNDDDDDDNNNNNNNNNNSNNNNLYYRTRLER
jgi:hypothetical protein